MASSLPIAAGNLFDESSSFTESAFTTSTGSTVWGPGALTGKALKVIGDTGLDFLCNLEIRRRLAIIKHVLKRNPEAFIHPQTNTEQQQMSEMYTDLKELCRKHYSLSHRRAATTLILRITMFARSYMTSFWDFDSLSISSNLSQWDSLLSSVPMRYEGPLWMSQELPKGTAVSSLSIRSNDDLPVAAATLSVSELSVDLDRAGPLYEVAIEALPTRHPDHPIIFINLTNGLLARYEETWRIANLDQAALLSEQALELCSVGSSDHEISHEDPPHETQSPRLGYGDRLRDWATPLFDHVLQLSRTGQPDPDRVPILNSLGNIFWIRFEESRQLVDLEWAVLLYEWALKDCAPGNSPHAFLLSNIALVRSGSADHDETFHEKNSLTPFPTMHSPSATLRSYDPQGRRGKFGLTISGLISAIKLSVRGSTR